MDPLFLTEDEVLEIHAQQIELYGGPDGVRDPACLESAVVELVLAVASGAMSKAALTEMFVGQCRPR